MAVQLTRRQYLSTSATALATTSLVRPGKKEVSRGFHSTGRGSDYG